MLDHAPVPADPKGSTAQTTWHFDILVADGFVLMELAGVVDTIRIANRITGHAPFTWSYRSAHGGPIESRCEAFVKTTPVPDRPQAEYAFVIGNSDPDTPALSIGPLIDRYTWRGAQVVLLAEAASRYITEHDEGHAQHSTHWENATLLQERLGLFPTATTLASVNGPIVTCAGMGATVDVVLALIGRHISAAHQTVLANVLLHDTIRDFATRQPYCAAQPAGDDIVEQCLAIMQANMDDPIPIRELCRVLDVSSRSLERRFQARFNTTPNTYYRELRLSKANNLLLNTHLSIRDIGLACGFLNGFSSVFKSFFGVTPGEVRKRRTQAPLTDLAAKPHSK